MIKECVVLNGKVINVGPWDDQGGSNPIPDGAVVEERDFEYHPDRGWYEVGNPAIPTAEERLEALEMAMLAMLDL
jgi:hypothetical protein